MMYGKVAFFARQEFPDKGSDDCTQDYSPGTEIHSGKYPEQATPDSFSTSTELSASPGRDQVIQALDCNDQYAPFYKEMNRELRNGTILKYYYS